MTQRLNIFKQLCIMFTVSVPLAILNPLLQPSAYLVDIRCPCAFEWQCQEKFEVNNPEAYLAILQVIPSCPSAQVRCCSTETMLLTIIDLGSSFNVKSTPDARLSNLFPQVASPIIHSPGRSSNSRHSSAVTCVSIAECGSDDIYGTSAEHFEKYGFISPAESNCLASEGKILCVSQDTNSEIPSSSLTTSSELSCTSQISCQEIFGTKGEHFVKFGPQDTCPEPDQVRCVTSPPLALDQVPAAPLYEDLPCVPHASCSVVFGTAGSHFSKYGLQSPCPTTSTRLVRCVLADVSTTPRPTVSFTTSTARPTTTSILSTSATRPTELSQPTTTIHPLFTTTSAPLQGPSAPVVHIIGPRPVYVSYNHINGPYSAGLDSSPSGSVQSSSNIGKYKEDQVKNLLEQLEKKLKHILGKSREH